MCKFQLLFFCSGQSLNQVTRRIANLFSYDNFAECYPEPLEKKDGVIESMNKAVEDFQNDLRTLASTETESNDKDAAEKKEEIDEEFSDENLR